MLGSIEVCMLIDRKKAVIRVAVIGALIELEEGGPTRIGFVNGGYLDVCGGIETFKREIEIVELGGQLPQKWEPESG